MRLSELSGDELSRIPLLEGITDNDAKRRVLAEAPHTSFSRNALPPELGFLAGTVDLGFENLGLDPEARKKIEITFATNGVLVPGNYGSTHKTRYKICWRGSFRSAVETASEEEAKSLPALPDYWAEAVLVMGEEDKLTWVGKRVRRDQLDGFDIRGYRDIGPALVPA